MTQLQLVGLLIILWGLYAVAAGVMGWRRARRGRLIKGLVRVVGPVGIRIVYVLAGAAIIAAGVFLMLRSAP